MTFRRLAAATLALGLVTAACSDGDGTTDQVADSGAESADTETLSISAATADGGTIDFADLAGTDVALWFWAPW